MKKITTRIIFKCTAESAKEKGFCEARGQEIIKSDSAFVFKEVPTLQKAITVMN